MAALVSVQDYVTEARVLLQDQVNAPYRYPDIDLLAGINLAFMEMRRLRPDLLLGNFTPIPSFTVVDGTSVPMDDQYKLAIVYYMCGNAQLRDEEYTEDARASMFMGAFNSMLVKAL